MITREIPLAALLRGISYTVSSGDPQRAAVSSIAIDSRGVEPGGLFVALRGEHVDGHDYVAQAVACGARAIVVERQVEVPANVCEIVVADAAATLSKIAAMFFGAPSNELTVAGVTGTNGKTTTTKMIASIVEAAGMRAGIIGTIGASFAGVDRLLANTTPLALELHALLAQMRESGVTAVAMEVSSHALALKRTDDVRFAIGALTNVSRDHLDFHGTLEAYAAAKRRLFDLAEYCVLNADDAFGKAWSEDLREKKPVTTYALRGDADLQARNIRLSADGSAFRVDGGNFNVHLPGSFNVANALCAIGVARRIGISDETSARGLAALKSVKGRMERVATGDFAVYVDYAHTPDALEHALRALAEVTAGRRILVFGCGGDRDRGKRPEMGAIAARLADATYVTSDNPRSENPIAIVREIAAGVGRAPHVIEPDRRKAIAAAIASARPGDSVLIAGKGHENYQIAGSQVLPFDDADEARRAVAERMSVRT